MKCVITGHTSGLGRAIYEHFLSIDWEVVGLSRSNGHDITLSQDEIVEIATGCDLFINNASYDTAQLDLLSRLCTKVSKIVTMGDIGTSFKEIRYTKYTQNMNIVETGERLISLSNDPMLADMLYLKLSFVENTYEEIIKPNRMKSEYTISYAEIINTIMFWLDNPNIKTIEFRAKLTDETIRNLKQVEDPKKVNQLCEKINQLIVK